MRSGESIAGVDTGLLTYSLDKLAIVFESSDPHVRAEAKLVVKQNFTEFANHSK